MTIQLEQRRCPQCGSAIRWRTPRQKTSSPVGCLDQKTCRWTGKYREAIHRGKSGKRDQMISSLTKSLDFEVAAAAAIQRTEDYALQHAFADPDADSNARAQGYASRLGDLMFLRDLLGMTDLDEETRRIIMHNETHQLFPGQQSVVKIAQ